MVIKFAGIESKYIREIGHDEADEILTELAETRMIKDYFL